MHIYCSDKMATKSSDSSKYQFTTCSLLNLRSLAISTSVIVPTPYSCCSKLNNTRLHRTSGHHATLCSWSVTEPFGTCRLSRMKP
jgi:hypothetical protein